MISQLIQVQPIFRQSHLVSHDLGYLSYFHIFPTLVALNGYIYNWDYFMIYNQLVLGAITHPIDNCWARAIAVDTLAISGVYSMFKHHQTDQ